MASVPTDLSLDRPDGSWNLQRGARRNELLIVALALLLPLAFMLMMVPFWWDVRGFGDVHFYAEAARRINAGEPIYHPLPEPGPLGFSEDWLLYIYPPFLAAVIALLPDVPLQTLERTFFVLNIICFWVFAFCLATLAQRRATFRGVLLAATALLLVPGGLWSVLHRNINPLLWALIGTALIVPAARGATLAAGTLLKVYPIWPLLFAVVRERRRVAVSAAVVVGAACLVGLVTLGARALVSETATWIAYIMPALSQGQFDVGGGPTPFIAWLLHGNWSPTFAPLALAHQLGWDHGGGELPGLVRAYLALVSMGAPMLTGWLTRRQPPETQYGAVLCAAVLFAPVLRPSYLPVLLIAPALLLRHADARRRAAARRAAASRPPRRARLEILR